MDAWIALSQGQFINLSHARRTKSGYDEHGRFWVTVIWFDGSHDLFFEEDTEAISHWLSTRAYSITRK